MPQRGIHLILGTKSDKVANSPSGFGVVNESRPSDVVIHMYRTAQGLNEFTHRLVRALLRFPGRSLMLEMKDIFYQNLERLQQMERLTSVLQYRATPQAAQTRDSCGAVSDRHPALVHLLLRIVRMRAHALGRYPLAILLLGAGSGAP
jgi:hypothetical protein